jgi:hypothetical protein
MTYLASSEDSWITVIIPAVLLSGSANLDVIRFRGKLVGCSRARQSINLF